MHKDSLLIWGLVSGLIVASASQCSTKGRGQSSASAINDRTQNRGWVNKSGTVESSSSQPGSSVTSVVANYDILTVKGRTFNVRDLREGLKSLKKAENNFRSFDRFQVPKNRSGNDSMYSLRYDDYQYYLACNALCRSFLSLLKRCHVNSDIMMQCLSPTPYLLLLYGHLFHMAYVIPKGTISGQKFEDILALNGNTLANDWDTLVRVQGDIETLKKLSQMHLMLGKDYTNYTIIVFIGTMHLAVPWIIWS